MSKTIMIFRPDAHRVFVCYTPPGDSWLDWCSRSYMLWLVGDEVASNYH